MSVVMALAAIEAVVQAIGGVTAVAGVTTIVARVVERVVLGISLAGVEGTENSVTAIHGIQLGIRQHSEGGIGGHNASPLDLSPSDRGSRGVFAPLTAL